MTLCTEDLARSFQAGEVDAASFRHRDHVAVAYEMLRTHEFMDVTASYTKTIRSIAAKAGVPEKFNATITVAFLSLIAERMSTTPHADCEDFIARNPDLLSKDLLANRYTPERLRSDLARAVFLLPDAE